MFKRHFPVFTKKCLHSQLEKILSQHNNVCKKIKKSSKKMKASQKHTHRKGKRLNFLFYLKFCFPAHIL